MAKSNPIKIAYSDDERDVFHAHIEKIITSYLKTNQLDNKYELKHHPSGTTGSIPDFVLTEKSSGKWVFVIEVKRTPNSVRSLRSWDQARSYVTNNRSLRWSSNSRPFFMVTNIEQSYLMCDVPDVSIVFCLLQNGEVDCGHFNNDATFTFNAFTTKVLPNVFNLLHTQKADHSRILSSILDNFIGKQKDLMSHVLKEIHGKTIKNNPTDFGFQDYDDYMETMKLWRIFNDPRADDTDDIDFKKVSLEIARDSLFRIFIYEYCREYFKILDIFNNLKSIRRNSISRLTNSIRFSLRDLENIDFSQIINARLMKFIPENIDDFTFGLLDNFLEILHSRIGDAIKQNGSPTYLLNLIMQNEKLYPWEEVNGDGKIMTDPELSDFVLAMCLNLFNNQNPPSVFDPCCGTGNLLSSAGSFIIS